MASASHRSSRGRGKSQPKRALRKPKSRRRKKVQARTSVEYNLLITATLMLLAIGAVMVFSASSTTSILSDGGLADSTFYLKRTLMVAALGLVLMHFAARRNLLNFREKTPLFLGFCFFLLFAVLAVGTPINGTKGWLVAGPIQVQPAEFMKLGLVLYGAHLFADRPDRVDNVRELGPYLLMTLGACFLMMMQPDMGTTMIVVFAVGITLFVAGARPRDMALLGGVVVTGAMFLALLAPYRRDRLLTFLHPESDVTGNGFQIIQAKIAIGSGGLDGVGIGNGVQKAFYLPEAHTDMISAVIGEEFGLIGIIAIVVIFGIFGYAGFQIAKNAKDEYGRILAASLTGLILVQASLNLYAVLGMAPLTGVPLPLVSYGNNSLIVSLIAIGLILNVARGGRAATARVSHPRRGPGEAAKLRLLEGGRDRQPSRRTAGSAQSRHSGGRYGGTRGPGRSRSRRA